MSYKDEWEGTRKELQAVIDDVIDTIQVELDIENSAKDMRKLFLDAFTRNLVQNELKDMINYILQEEQPC